MPGLLLIFGAGWRCRTEWFSESHPVSQERHMRPSTWLPRAPVASFLLQFRLEISSCGHADCPSPDLQPGFLCFSVISMCPHVKIPRATSIVYLCVSSSEFTNSSLQQHLRHPWHYATCCSPGSETTADLPRSTIA